MGNKYYYTCHRDVVRDPRRGGEEEEEEEEEEGARRTYMLLAVSRRIYLAIVLSM